MTAARPSERPHPFPELAALTEKPPSAERLHLAQNAAFHYLWEFGADEVACYRVRSFVLDNKLMRAKHIDALMRETRKDHAEDFGEPPRSSQNGEGSAEVLPPRQVRMSSGDWRYATDSDDFDRGLYFGARFIAGLPYVHARVIHRDGAGRRKGTSYLLSAAGDGPRLVVGHLRIRDGSWAGEVGITLPDDPKAIQAAGTAIRQLAEDAPEREAITRADGDALAVPPQECLPPGYLAASETGHGQALAVWGREVIPLAAMMPNLADIVGASAFAPFAGPLRVPSHVVDAYGDADRGKTTAARLGASIWGDCRGETGTVRLWNFSSDISVARFLGTLGVLPAFIDEGGASGFGPAQWGALVYRVAGGASRNAAEYQGDGNKIGLPWHGILFVTGNGRVGEGLSTGKWAGIPKRIVESAAPFTVDAEHAEKLDQLAEATFGHIGAEILERYTVADARNFLAAAAEMVGMPPGGNPRTWAKELQAHVAGAMMLDAICGTGEVLTSAAADYAADFLAMHCSEPKHDADLLLDKIRESIARERTRWPTVAEYREHLKAAAGYGDADPSRIALPQVGVAHFGMAGVRADDDSWIAVFPSVMHEEFCQPHGITEDRAFPELFKRDVLKVAPSYRAKGDWLTLVRLEQKPRSPERMYKLELPAEDDEAPDEDTGTPGTRSEGSENSASPGAPHANIFPREPVTPVTSQVRAGEQPVTHPVTQPVTHPVTPPGIPPGTPDGGASEPISDACAVCGEALAPWLIAQGARRHVACATDDEFTAVFGAGPSRVADAARNLAIVPVPEPPAGEGQAADAAPMQDAPSDAAPAGGAGRATAPARAAAKPRYRWIVLGGNGRAYAAGGEVIELAENALKQCTNLGELAALAMSLGAERCYVPRAARQVLGLPAELGRVTRPREGVPHIWVEATDTASWDIWPNDPAGLAGWMNIYRQPATLHEGVDLAFPEWLANTPALGALEAPELARTLELIHLATTYRGEGSGGVEFHRSPAATFGRLLDKAARYSRTGRPDVVTLPPPYDHQLKRPREAPAAPRPPGQYIVPAGVLPPVPEGWTIARLDTRSSFAAAVNGTNFGDGEAEHRQGGELVKAWPALYLVRTATASVHPWLTPFAVVPARSGEAREICAWMDGHAAWWLHECGVSVDVLESWVWPRRRRLFDSAVNRLGEARTRLEAAAVIKAMNNTFIGGWLGSDFGGDRRDDDWTARRDWWLSARVQAEVRKQRNLLPAIKAGSVVVIGSANVDSVYVAAADLAAIEAMPGTGGRPAVAGQRGKFRIEAHATVTAELAGLLADPGSTAHGRRTAIEHALGEE